MTFNKLVIHLISSTSLKLRKKYITGTLETIKNIAEECKFNVSINIITEPDIEYIEKNIDKYNKRVNYDKTDDNEFNSLNQRLNMPQISNIEKHRNVYTLISNMSSPDILHYILEDDVLVSGDYLNNIKELFNNINNFKDEWDILFTCISNNEDNKSFKLLKSIDHFKILISKSSYFIKYDTAILLNKFLETIKYNMKVAMSKFIIDNPNINAMILNKHTLLEGSKIGIFLSSINNNNFLYQNNDFIKLTKLLNQNIITPDIITEAEKIYNNNVLNSNNADFQHSMGILYYKMNDYKNAKKYLIEAVLNVKKNDGIITNYSEILNNCINMHQYDQPDIEECLLKPSKY